MCTRGNLGYRAKIESLMELDDEEGNRGQAAERLSDLAEVR